MVNDVLRLRRSDSAHRESFKLVDYLKTFVEQFCQIEKIDPDDFRDRAARRSARRFRPQPPEPGDVEPVPQRGAPLPARESEHPRRRRAWSSRDATVKLDVIDDGPGVPAALRSQLFEPFFTTATGGTGPRSLHRARSVRSEQRAARLRRDRAGRTVLGPVQGGVNGMTADMSKSQILVVDDEADIRELLGMTLTRMGLDAHCAGTTAEALALLGKHSYELCLTDMRLPDGDGLAVLALRLQAPSEPAGRGHHRARQRRKRGRGAEGGRVRLPREARLAQPAAHAGALGAQALDARRRGAAATTTPERSRRCPC